MQKIKKAVIPAAGLGTRFLPITKSMPKEMLPVVHKPVIQYVIEEAYHSGITDILIITGKGKRSLEDYFDKNNQIENNKFRVVAKRYYNKNNELLCSDKDMGNEFKSSWEKIVRGSLIQDAYYDLVTRYKVNLTK